MPPLPPLSHSERKKILLLSDDFRVPSGCGTISRELIFGTCHHYNWVQIAAGINHPEAGKTLDFADVLKNETTVTDAYLRLYPTNGYGDPQMLRNIIMAERPDAILHFTDPRYWEWLYRMEAEVRQICPIIYYTIWDDMPFPRYNRDFYRSSDTLLAISKQTHNIIKHVIGKDNVSVIPMDNILSETT